MSISPYCPYCHSSYCHHIRTMLSNETLTSDLQRRQIMATQNMASGLTPREVNHAKSESNNKNKKLLLLTRR